MFVNCRFIFIKEKFPEMNRKLHFPVSTLKTYRHAFFCVEYCDYKILSGWSV